MQKISGVWCNELRVLHNSCAKRFLPLKHNGPRYKVYKSPDLTAHSAHNQRCELFNHPNACMQTWKYLPPLPSIQHEPDVTQADMQETFCAKSVLRIRMQIISVWWFVWSLLCRNTLSHRWRWEVAGVLRLLWGWASSSVAVRVSSLANLNTDIQIFFTHTQIWTRTHTYI